MKTIDDQLDVQDLDTRPQPDHYRVHAVDGAGVAYHLDVESEDPAAVVPHALAQPLASWTPDVPPDIAILAAKQARAKLSDAEKLDVAKAVLAADVAAVNG